MANALVTGVTGQLGYLRRRAAGQARRQGLGSGPAVDAWAAERGRRGAPLPADHGRLCSTSIRCCRFSRRFDRIASSTSARRASCPPRGRSRFLPPSTPASAWCACSRRCAAPCRSCRILQAGSSELFAGADRSPQDEEVPIRPLNPYGIAKAFAYHTMRAYRAQYRKFATNALFLHERVAATVARVPVSQGDPRGGRDCRGADRPPLAREPGDDPRLGLCA